jgi:hypothetical protein
MRSAGRGLTLGSAMLMASLIPGIAGAVPYAEQPAAKRALYTGIAVVGNVVPVVSTLYAPRCLLGYVVCKAVFAAMSTIAAADQLAWSGGGDMAQTRGILHRGFAGDWFLTGRHVSGEVEPQVLPDPPPPPSTGGWEPPPL